MFIKMPDIPKAEVGLKNIIHAYRFKGIDKDNCPIYNYTILPKKIIYGSIKLHGSNAGIRFENGKIISESKSRVLTIENDNYGFAKWVKENEVSLWEIHKQVKARFRVDNFTIKGEWAGHKIQDKVGISTLPKAFYMFALFIPQNDEEYQMVSPKDLIHFTPVSTIDFYNVWNVGFYRLEVDLNLLPEVFTLLNKFTKEVEESDPVVEWLTGYKNTLGEGIVWWIQTKHGHWTMFKTKGDKHAKARKKMPKVFNESYKKHIEDIAQKVTPNWRIDQGILEVFGTEDLDVAKLGELLKWVNKDILKEDIDIIEESGLTFRDISRAVSRIVKEVFFDLLKEEIK